jgi:alkanesulfonate monooxygenase SsuD/methylene tetrahydromethanopterin reductase-like flavin-dependent oxidoreductase (luciferase family)
LSHLDTTAFYAAMLEQVDYADQAGLDSIWVTEHHFTEDGYLAAVMPAMAAIAARTTRVTIGTYACNLGLREMKQYHQALRDCGKDPAAFSVVNSRLVYIVDSEDQAWQEIEASVLYQMTLYGKWLSAAGFQTSYFRPDPEVLRRNSVIGPPAVVTERLQQILATTPMTELCLSMQLPGLDPRKALRSLERFATEVLPVLRKERVE